MPRKDEETGSSDFLKVEEAVKANLWAIFSFSPGVAWALIEGMGGSFQSSPQEISRDEVQKCWGEGRKVAN